MWWFPIPYSQQGNLSGQLSDQLLGVQISSYAVTYTTDRHTTNANGILVVFKPTNSETPLFMVAFGHMTQTQTLAYLCIQDAEIGDLYGMEL